MVEKAEELTDVADDRLSFPDSVDKICGSVPCGGGLLLLPVLSLIEILSKKAV